MNLSTNRKPTTKEEKKYIKDKKESDKLALRRKNRLFRYSFKGDFMKLIESKKNNIPYRFVCGKIDYTPRPLKDTRFHEISDPFDIGDFITYFFHDKFVKSDMLMLQLQETQIGLLTGFNYEPNLLDLEMIQKQDTKIQIPQKNMLKGLDDGIDMDGEIETDRIPSNCERFIEESFKIILQETETIVLASYRSNFVDLDPEDECLTSYLKHEVQVFKSSNFKSDEELCMNYLINVFEKPEKIEIEKSNETVSKSDSKDLYEEGLSDETTNPEISSEKIKKTSLVNAEASETNETEILIQDIPKKLTLFEVTDRIGSFCYERDNVMLNHLKEKTVYRLMDAPLCKEQIIRCTIDTSTPPIITEFSDVCTSKVTTKNQSTSVTPINFFQYYKAMENDQKLTKFESNIFHDLINNDEKPSTSCVFDSQNFEYVFLTVERILEYYNFRSEQIKFLPKYFTMLSEDELPNHLSQMFTLNLPKKMITPGVAYEITSICWHPLNNLVIGVGHGKMHNEIYAKGLVTVWNMKSPSKPERVYKFHQPVTCVLFSSLYPYAMVTSFHTGHVIIINIKYEKLTILFSTYNYLVDGFPTTHLSWFKDKHENDEFLVSSTKSGYLFCYRKIFDFTPELLLDLPRSFDLQKGIDQYCRLLQSNENNYYLKIGVTTFVQHPTELLTYLVGMDDGCIHICSLLKKSNDTDVFAAHNGPITNIEFHPGVNKLFLTSGNDFYVRVWVYQIFEPIMYFSARKEFIRSAKWLTYNPMLIIAMSATKIDVWDLRRVNNTIPVSTLTNTENIDLLTLVISPHGPHLAIGDANGNVNIYLVNIHKNEPKFKVNIFATSLYKHIKCRDEELWKRILDIIPEFEQDPKDLDILELLS